MMRTSLSFEHAFPQRDRSFQHGSGLVLFWALAFLPAIVHLAMAGISIMNPITALGPLLAGFWFATSVRGIRVHFGTLAVVVATLLWAVNLMMAAGCCKTTSM